MNRDSRPSEALGDVGVALSKSKRAYVIWWTTMPAVVLTLSFTGLCIYECVVAPWYALFVTPIASAVLGIVAAVSYWRWASSLPEAEKGEVHRFICMSILWGPARGFFGIFVLIMLAQVVAALFAAIW